MLGDYSKKYFPLRNMKVLWSKGRYYLTRDKDTIYLLFKLNIKLRDVDYFKVLNKIKLNITDDIINAYIRGMNRTKRVTYASILISFNRVGIRDENKFKKYKKPI